MTVTKHYCDHCGNEVRNEDALREVVVNRSSWIGRPFVRHVCDNCREDIEHYVGTAKHTKPPLGLIPRFIRDEARVKEILEAIGRYNENGKPVPIEWLDELNEKIKKEDTPCAD